MVQPEAWGSTGMGEEGLPQLAIPHFIRRPGWRDWAHQRPKMLRCCSHGRRCACQPPSPFAPSLLHPPPQATGGNGALFCAFRHTPRCRHGQDERGQRASEASVNYRQPVSRTPRCSHIARITNTGQRSAVVKRTATRPRRRKRRMRQTQHFKVTGWEGWIITPAHVDSPRVTSGHILKPSLWDLCLPIQRGRQVCVTANHAIGARSTSRHGRG